MQEPTRFAIAVAAIGAVAAPLPPQRLLSVLPAIETVDKLFDLLDFGRPQDACVTLTFVLGQSFPIIGRLAHKTRDRYCAQAHDSVFFIHIRWTHFAVRAL